VERTFTILIADRNPRIRQFLMREFTEEGYRVLLAQDKDDLLRIIRRDDTLDLLILDDEMLVPEEARIVEQLANRVPHLPLIVHSFSAECTEESLAREAAALVEKKGNVGELKNAVDRVLHSEYPSRFDRIESTRHLQRHIP
jgi:DNA-binding NtrC family response regulator